MAPTTIKVKVSTTIRHSAERAIVIVNVKFEDAVPGRAALQLANTVRVLRSECRGTAGAAPSSAVAGDPSQHENNHGRPIFAADWSASPLTISQRPATQFDWANGAQGATMHSAAVVLRLHFHDMESMRRFVTAHAGDQHIVIGEPVWGLSDSTLAHLQAKAVRNVYRDAHNQAVAFAAAARPDLVIPLALGQEREGLVSVPARSETVALATAARPDMFPPLAVGQEREGVLPISAAGDNRDAHSQAVELAPAQERGAMVPISAAGGSRDGSSGFLATRNILRRSRMHPVEITQGGPVTVESQNELNEVVVSVACEVVFVIE